MSRGQIDWQEDEESQEEETQNTDMETDAVYPGTPSAILRRLIRWGWLRSDYDEKLNTYILSFPEYSQMRQEKERASLPFTVHCSPIILIERKTARF